MHVVANLKTVATESHFFFPTRYLSVSTLSTSRLLGRRKYKRN